MARWFHIRNGSGAAACLWGTSTSSGQTQRPGDALVATNGDGRADARFRFSAKDKEGRFTLETPTGQFATINAAGDIVLGPSSPGDARQLWSWGRGGQLINGQSGQAAAFVPAPEGQKLTTRAPKAGETTQVWNVVASGPPDNSPVALWNSFQQTTVTIPGTDPPVQVPGTAYQVAAINGANLATGIAVVTGPLIQSTPGQLWLCDATTGTIVCAENPNLLLTATDAGPVYVAAPLVAPANPAYQQWLFSAQGGALTNTATNQVLTCNGSGAQLTVQTLSPNDASQTWGWTPGSPLDAIVNQPPSGFPAFDSGTQPAAYAYINAQLGVTDLRQQYTNADTTTLQNYASDIDGYTCPSDVESSDWIYVTGQLKAELQAVTSVQGLFSLYSDFNTAVFSADSTVLTDLGNSNSMNFSNSPVKNGLVVPVLENTIYTLLSALPEFGGIIGNLFETGFNAALAESDISTETFNCAYSELWNQLYPNFQEINDSLSNKETVIEQNWGMLQAVTPLISQQVGPDSLFWSTAYSGQYQSNAIQGYSLQVMKMLMFTQYCVLRWGGLPDQSPPIGGMPAGSAWWVIGDYFANVFCQLMPINDIWPNWSYPSSDVMNSLINAGGQASDFYPAIAGWHFDMIDAIPVQIVGTQSHPVTPLGNWQFLTLLATVVNMSEYELTVAVYAEPNKGNIEVIGNTTRPLGPYASMNFACDHGSDGLLIEVTVTDPLTGGPQAYCQLHLEKNDISGFPEKVWVDSQTSSGGLSIGTCTDGFYNSQDTYLGCGWVSVPLFYVKS